MVLRFLFELQSIQRKMKLTKKNMKNKDLYERLDIVRDKYKTLKRSVEMDTVKLDDYKRESERLGRNLKCLDLKLKESNDRLYRDGENVKTIENLEKEIENCKARIDEIENQLLKLIELNDGLEKTLDEGKRQLELYRSEFEDLKAKFVKINESSRQELEELTSVQNNIVKEIDEAILKQYNDIACKINNPVSKVIDGICTECGVRLNSMLLSSLSKRDKIYLCEHCGRMLYLE